MPKINKGKKQRTKIGGGSGFIVSSDGYIFTSNHVVGDKEADYTVIFDPKKKYPAKIISRDPVNDVAILKSVQKSLSVLLQTKFCNLSRRMRFH